MGFSLQRHQAWINTPRDHSLFYNQRARASRSNLGVDNAIFRMLHARGSSAASQRSLSPVINTPRYTRRASKVRWRATQRDSPMKHPILALVLASAPLIVSAAPASAVPAPAPDDLYRPVQDLPVVTIRARRIGPVSATAPAPVEHVPSIQRSRTPPTDREPLGHLVQELVATRMELAHVQLELARLRLELRKALAHYPREQCEMAAASAPSRVP